ncbi:MAG: TatD family hydrolase [Lachnospiraceae bacterium]|jgi:TatD DNase family protein|nr:TatD family hydrolase [Lachnospiraceae bacterium]
MIFESHAHYDDKAFDKDRDLLLERMQEQGVGTIINVSASMRGVRDTLALTERYPFIYGAVGIHPDEVGELNEENFSWLQEQCGRKKVVAVGEIGLDYYWDKESHEQQKYWFIRQLSLAREQKLPVIIHSREAAQDTMDLMKEHGTGLEGVIHCFSYSPEMAREYVKMGYYIGVGGVVTFKNAKKLKETVQQIPLERILLETDSPYLAPVPYRGKRNCSFYLSYVAKEIGALKGISPEEVICVTERNAQKMYRLEETEHE